MLCELRVKNLALIESLELSFEAEASSNLVVMTGETGAGKSIMLRAITLLSGGRAKTEWIRSGAESCEVEALFEIDNSHSRLLEKLREGGFGSEGSLIIKRIVNSSGRSRFYVNGSLATAKIVSEISAELLNVASQHDQQLLLRPNQHLDYLDIVGGLWPLRDELKSLYVKWDTKSKELHSLQVQEQEKAQRQDYLKFQLSEIQEASLAPGEEELLLAEKKRLKNAQALIDLSQASFRLLSSELMDGLIQLRQNVSQLASLDSQASKMSEEIINYTFVAEDHVAELRAYKDSLENDPYRLEQVNERLDIIQQLKRKYGESIEEILVFAKNAERELQYLESMGKEMESLAEEVQSLSFSMCQAGAKLSEKRKTIAVELAEAMEKELQSLAFDKPQFRVAWLEVEHIPEKMKNSGWDRGEFLFSANLGEVPKPLAKIASGGELSRLMLAMKCLLAKKDMVETVIFDEVDAGIGGQAAEAVSKKIQELAGHHQVFCITHLPQIAARGSMHFQVAKNSEQGRTQTKVKKLSREARVTEIVRMLAGDSATKQTQAWAEELLAKGKRRVSA